MLFLTWKDFKAFFTDYYALPSLFIEPWNDIVNHWGKWTILGKIGICIAGPILFLFLSFLCIVSVFALCIVFLMMPICRLFMKLPINRLFEFLFIKKTKKL